MEKWKAIENHDGYEISNFGRVKSIKNGRCFIHKQRLNTDGYVKATLRTNGKIFETRVHRLVATHFIDNPLNLETVNHKNGIKTDNNINNLEWMNRHDQIQHAYNMGFKKPMQGVLNPISKLNESDVKYIKCNYVRNSKEFGTVALGRKFGVDNTIIWKIINGVSYKNIK